MEKSRWLDFLSLRLKSQISLETAEKAETWALALLSLVSLGGALGAVGGGDRGEQFLDTTKVLFLFFFYALLVFGVHLFGFLQRGDRPVARLLGIRDFTSLTALSLALTFYSFILLIVAHQVASGAERMGASNFFVFLYWLVDFTALTHSLASVFFLASLFFFPKVITRWIESGSKFRYPVFGLHLTLLVLLGFGYAELIPIGSADFFGQFRTAGLFWIFIGTSLLLIGRLLHQPSVPALATLELDIASGRLERPDDILPRFKEAFTSPWLVAWTNRLSHTIAAQTEKIARYSHEAIHLVSHDVPSEIDLNQVEDRYRRAEALHQKLEKENQRFLLSIWLFDLNETARARVEELRDQFSRELRNTKLEIASVRKKIDEKLVSIKNREVPLPPPPPSPAPKASQIPAKL